MGTKWTLASNTTVGDRLANIGNAALHLSTGDLVMLLNDPSQSDPNKISLVLVPGTAHTTPQTIAVISSGATGNGYTFASGQSMTIVRDARDNIFVIGLSGDGNGTRTAQAFTKSTGLTWVAQTALKDNGSGGGSSTQAGGGASAVWVNSGGGTSSAGHILVQCFQNTGSNWQGSWFSIDAGALLAGTGNLVASLTSGFAVLGNGNAVQNNHDIVCNGFGATSGMAIIEGDSTHVYATAWTMNSSGILTSFGTDILGSGSGALTAALTATTKVGVYYLSSNRFACVYPSTTHAGQLSVQLVSSTAKLGSVVDSGTSGNFPTPSATLSWDASVASGNLWIYGWSSVTATTMLRVEYTFPADVTTLGSTVTDDTGLGTTNTTIRAVNQPVDTTHVDYQWYETTSPYALMGDFSLLPGPTNAPVLGPPVNNDVEYLAGGYTFDWLFSSPQFGDAQVSYAFKRQASGGSVEWWNAGTVAWQGTEVFNTSAVNAVTFPASKWTVGTTYTWTVATKGSSGIAGPYAGLFTIYSAQTLPTTPSLTATYDSTNNRVSLVLTGTGTDVMEVQVSRDGGSTWSDVRGASAVPLVAGAATVYDYEGVSGVLQSYRCRQYNTSQAPYDAPSAWSATVTATPLLTTYWLRDPASATPIGQAVYFVDGTFITQLTENSTVHWPLGASNPTVLADTRKGEDGQGTFFTRSQAEDTTLKTLLNEQSTLLLQSLVTGDQWYIRQSSSPQKTIVASLGTTWYREWACTWVNVAKP